MAMNGDQVVSTGGGGGFIANAKASFAQHKWLWIGGIAGALLLILYIVHRANMAASTSGLAVPNPSIDPTTGLPIGGQQSVDPSTSPAGLQSEMDAILSSEGQNNTLLTQILGKPGTPTPTPSPNPTPTPVPPPSRPPPPTNNPIFYMIRGGDTLSSIASAHNMSWQTLEQLGSNRQVIESTARQHGFTSNFQNWIFPGEKIQV